MWWWWWWWWIGGGASQLLDLEVYYISGQIFEKLGGARDVLVPENLGCTQGEAGTRVVGGFQWNIISLELSTYLSFCITRTKLDEMASNPPPNLADILRTLSALAPQPEQQQQQHHQQHQGPQNPYHFSAPIPQPRPPFALPTQHAHPQQRPPVQAQAVIDPAGITDWPTALRCVMKTVASNDRIVGEIRKVCTPARGV